MSEIVERMATLEANQVNAMTVILDIKHALAKIADKQTAILETVAVIDSKQDDMKEYQESCDDDRKGYGTRLTILENDNKNQKKIAGGIAGFVTIVITGAWEWFTKK